MYGICIHCKNFTNIFQNVVHYKAKGNITVTYIVITATFDLEFEFDAP